MIFGSCGEDMPKQLSGELFSRMSPDQTGIDFRNDLMEDIYSAWNVLSYEYYYNGAGVSLGDINNDGLLDVFFTGNTSPNKLYLNKGNFKFEDITKSAGILPAGWSTGSTIADVNNDGRPDIYVCQAGPDKVANKRRNLLYINQGNSKFVEQAKQYGLDDPNLSTQAAFFDMDKDGDLDCYVMNESFYFRVPLGDVLKDIENKTKLRQASGKMFRNDGGKFTDITEKAGMLRYGYGLGLVVSDINEDGYPDVYVANDYSVPDMMYINQKDGTFKDEIKDRTKQISWFSMGVDIADVNNDLHKDIAVVDMATGDHIRGKTLMASMNPQLFQMTLDLGYQRQHMFNAFQINDGSDNYNNLAGMYKLLKTEWSWASLIADFDNDGYKDYFVSNGYRRYSRDNDSRIRLRKAREANGGNVPNHLRKELFDQIPQIPIENVVYHNKKGQKFEEVGADWGINDAGYSNGAAYGDLDNDGDLDLIVNNIDDAAFVYRNNSNGSNNYLTVQLSSPKAKEGAYVVVKNGDNKQLLEYGTVRGFQSTVTNLLHFGLADSKVVDELTVVWPDKKFQKLANVKINQKLILKHKNAQGNYQKEKANSEVDFVMESDKLFMHKENAYDDFVTEILVPFKQSTLGPFMSHADVNGDGKLDFYIGGAKGQSGSLFLQQADANFKASSSQPWTSHKNSEDLGSHFFDADGDGDLDLYVVSGGNDFAIGDKLLQDRLYINNGNGNFSYNSSALPSMLDSGSRIKSADIDGDGDLDLFVCGRLMPKNYPRTGRSYLLENNNGKFTDVTFNWSEELMNPGLVNDAIWTDLNGDGKQDLVLTGEWMSVRSFVNTGSALEESSEYFDSDLKGWHFKIQQADLDGDGDQDFVVGNLGLNSKFSASKEHPFQVLANDFDGNGTCDIVLAKDYKGKTVPVRGRECSSQQMPFILDKFKTYNEFANASVEDILGADKIKEGLQLSVNNFNSGIYINEGGKYTFQALPFQAQAFPVMGIVTEDVNSDGKMDIVLAGNIYNMEIETPRLDSGDGLVLLGDGKLGYTPLKAVDTGFKASKDVKDILALDTAGGKKALLIANNNGPLEIFKF